MNMFEKATKNKYRFNATKGSLSVEDLWDLPLRGKTNSLDALAKLLNKQLKETAEDSFVDKITTTDSTLVTKFDIVKHIIEFKLEAEAAAKTRADNKAKKEQLLSIIKEREDEDLRKKTPMEDLRKMLDELS